jgi:hypothetical protein
MCRRRWREVWLEKLPRTRREACLCFFTASVAPSSLTGDLISVQQAGLLNFKQIVDAILLFSCTARP